MKVYEYGVGINKQGKFQVLIANSTEKTYKIMRRCLLGRVERVHNFRPVNIIKVSRGKIKQRNLL